MLSSSSGLFAFLTRSFVRSFFVLSARSVYERAVDVDYQNVNLWLKYAEMEMRHKNISHARNIWDRAVTLLPRVSQFWYKKKYSL